MRLKSRESSPEEICPLCKVQLAAEIDPVQPCEGCQTKYHADCLAELGDCATLGCAQKGVPLRGSARPARTQADLDPKEREWWANRLEALRNEHEERLPQREWRPHRPAWRPRVAGRELPQPIQWLFGTISFCVALLLAIVPGLILDTDQSRLLVCSVVALICLPGTYLLLGAWYRSR